MKSPDTTLEDSGRTSREIEADIRERREKMDGTLDELGSRLSLRSLVHGALEWWDAPETSSSAAARRAVRSLSRHVKEHPLPSLMIGGGIAWWLAESEDDGPPRQIGTNEGNTGGLGEKVSHAKEAAAGAVDTAKEKLSGAGHAVQEKAEHLREAGKSAVEKTRHGLSDGYQAGARRFGRAVDDAPLAVGMAFAALGLLAGITLPHTRKEDELMGEASGHLLESAKQKGGELLEEGKAIGGRVAAVVKEEVREQGLSGGDLAQGLATLAEKGSHIAAKAKEEAGRAVEEEFDPPKPQPGPA